MVFTQKIFKWTLNQGNIQIQFVGVSGKIHLDFSSNREPFLNAAKSNVA